MLHDIKTVVWKEFREWFGAGAKGHLNIVVFAGVFGVLMPLQFGAAWLSSPFAVLNYVWLPFLMVSATSADTIAGERDRHTLETLLATRLSDRVVFTGKLTACILYAVVQLWGISLIALVAVNVVHWSGRVAFYSPPVATAILLMPLLLGVFAGTTGSLVSMKAKSARAAQQTMSAVSFVLIIPLFVINFLPESAVAWLGTAFSRVGGTTVALLLTAAVVVADAVLLRVALRKFRRERLAL
jgi:ABC-2 type transport system permease protein